MRRPTRGALAAALATLTLAFVAMPVSAVDGADFLIWQWNAPGGRGLGLVKTGSGTMQVEVIGLRPNRTHELVLNSVGCGRSRTPSNTLATYSLHADAQGGANAVVVLENTLISSIKSVRLFRSNSQLDCGKVAGYSSTGGDRPLESISFLFFNGNGMHFAVEVENDETHWVGHDFVSSKSYEMRASHSRCPNQPSAIILEEILISSVRGTVYGATSTAVDPWDIRSFQLFDGTQRIACGSAIRAKPV